MKLAGPVLLSFNPGAYLNLLIMIISAGYLGMLLALLGSVLGVAFVLPAALLVIVFLMASADGSLWIVCPPH